MSRCKPCIRKQAAADLAALAESRARAAAAAAAKMTAAGDVKACRTCKQTKPVAAAFAAHKRSGDGHRRDCRECVAEGRIERKATADQGKRNSPERRAQNRIAVKSWKQRNPEAYRASQQLNAAIRRGSIARPERCQVQGCDFRGKTQAHHHDYSLPLVAVFCCPRHHRRLHAGEKLKLINGLPQALVAVPDAA